MPTAPQRKDKSGPTASARQNSLMIESPARPVIFLAFAQDRNEGGTYLRNLPLELDGIRKAFQNAWQAQLCEVVERSNTTVENILDVFQEYQDRIAIFHYSGHADSYELLLATLTGEHTTAHREGLVSFLARQKGLQLVFLNGCYSQPQALDLIAAGLPAVVGTSQKIDDGVATKLSVRFYQGMAAGLGADAVDSMFYSEYANFSGANWVKYTAVGAVVLSPGDSLKTVHARFKDISANESAVRTATIVLDRSNPDFPPFPHTAPPNATPGRSVSITQLVAEDNLAGFDLFFRRVGETWDRNARKIAFVNSTAVIDSERVNSRGLDDQIIATDKAGRSATLPNDAIGFFSLPACWATRAACQAAPAAQLTASFRFRWNCRIHLKPKMYLKTWANTTGVAIGAFIRIPAMANGKLEPSGGLFIRASEADTIILPMTKSLPRKTLPKPALRQQSLLKANGRFKSPQPAANSAMPSITSG